MDKFDQHIIDAKQEYEPKHNRTEEIMNQITNQAPKRRLRAKILISALVGLVAVCAIIFVAWPKAIETSSSPSATSTADTGQSTTPSTSPVADTSDTSLQTDLNDAQASMDQTANDQSGADTAINDSQQQIAVPTS